MIIYAARIDRLSFVNFSISIFYFPFFFSTLINSQETYILFEGMLIIVKSYQSPGSRESIRYILGHILPLNSTPVITFVTMYDTTN